MIRILFVCHGNICRSPMAEFVMRDLVEGAGLGDCVRVESAATSSEELGNPVHRGTRGVLNAMGIDCSRKRARRIVPADYSAFDLIVGMDEANMRNMRRAFGGDPEGKLHKLLSFAGRGGDVADPWYTGDFEQTRADVCEGCTALLDHLKEAGLLHR